jgi:hypothetical protein
MGGAPRSAGDADDGADDVGGDAEDAQDGGGGGEAGWDAFGAGLAAVLPTSRAAAPKMTGRPLQ